MLPDHAIAREIDAGHLRIDPFDPALIQPASIDVRLGHQFRRLTTGVPILDPVRGVTGDFRASTVEDDEVYVMEPDTFVLAHTLETFGIPPWLVGRLEGKSSLGRLGLSVHSTAGFIDPGFRGEITLELSLDGPVPVTLEPGMRIGQLSLTRLEAPAAYPYGHPRLGSHYQGQFGATVPAALSPSRRAPEVVR